MIFLLYTTSIIDYLCETPFVAPTGSPFDKEKKRTPIPRNRSRRTIGGSRKKSEEIWWVHVFGPYFTQVRTYFMKTAMW